MGLSRKLQQDTSMLQWIKLKSMYKFRKVFENPLEDEVTLIAHCTTACCVLCLCLLRCVVYLGWPNFFRTKPLIHQTDAFCKSEGKNSINSLLETWLLEMWVYHIRLLLILYRKRLRYNICLRMTWFFVLFVFCNCEKIDIFPPDCFFWNYCYLDCFFLSVVCNKCVNI